ncbi:MAG: general secretion pathway protein [Acidobacteria bacterium]|nr:MAG: general secretion pathway protein [Acidobacteriota bacterium]PYS65232.1 MAG: general secretion pathway protein [Acidobacteriota bacterium]
MYTEFYGLKELPFALTPDPRYIYFTPSHTEVMANLHYGIESGRGLIVVTGEVGTGKTTMLRWVMQRLDRTVLVAYIFNPRLSVPEFYQHLAALFDVRNWETKSDLLIELGKVLDSRHSRGLRTVLIVDEAHGLSPVVLEEVRLLCNFESDTAKKLQIVLTGQPELREVLNYPDLRQLKQRVSLRCEITALPNVEETAQYIHSRLKIAGAPRANIFSPGAIDYIFRCSEGIPRNINNLCDNALLNGFAAGESVISRAIVEEVAATFDMVPRADRLKNSEEREGPARIFNAAGRAELWAAGNGDSGNGNGSNGEFPTDAYSFTTRVAEPEIIFNEHARQESPTTIEELGSAFNASGLGSLSVPPALAGGSYFDKPSSTLNPPANAGGTDRFGRGNNGQNL